MRRIVRRPDLGSWYFLGETLFVRVLYRPFFTRKKPSMAFFRCLFSVLLRLHAEKAIHGLFPLFVQRPAEASRGKSHPWSFSAGWAERPARRHA